MQNDAKLELADLKRQVVYLQVFARRLEITHLYFVLYAIDVYLFSFYLYKSIRIYKPID